MHETRVLGDRDVHTEADRRDHGGSRPTIGPVTTLHDFTMTSIRGDEIDLADYDGTVCLVVNVASR